MSWLTDIKNEEHSAVAWITSEIEKFDKAEPAIAKIVDAGVTYAGGALQIALSATGDTAAAGIVGTVISQANQDLTTASALVTDFGATPTAASIFNSVKTNLSSLLTDSHVTNTQSVAAVNKAINEVGVIGSAISTAATNIAAAASNPAAPAA